MLIGLNKVLNLYLISVFYGFCWIRIQSNFWYGSGSREMIRIRRIRKLARPIISSLGSLWWLLMKSRNSFTVISFLTGSALQKVSKRARTSPRPSTRFRYRALNWSKVKLARVISSVLPQGRPDWSSAPSTRRRSSLFWAKSLVMVLTGILLSSFEQSCIWV